MYVIIYYKKIRLWISVHMDRYLCGNLLVYLLDQRAKKRIDICYSYSCKPTAKSLAR